MEYIFDDYGNELLPVPKTVSQVNEYIKYLIEEEVMGYYVGHTSNFIKVKVKSSNVIERNSIIKVKVEKAYDSYVIAKEEL